MGFKDVIICDNCTKEYCASGIFSCNCDKLDLNYKCHVCKSNGMDCMRGDFTLQCPTKYVKKVNRLSLGRILKWI